MHRPVIAEELAIGPFGLGIAGLVEIALDNDLGVGRHQAGRSRPRAPSATARRAWLPTRSNSSSAEARTLAVTKSSGCEPIAKLTGRCSPRATDSRNMRRRSDVCVRFERMVVRERSISRRQPTLRRAGHRIDRVVDRRRDIGRAVVLMLHMERQPHQVDGIAGQDHLLHRRLALRNLEGLLRTLHPARHTRRPARARRRGQRRPP